MPVDGLPDPSRHAICRKCLQWHHRHEGSSVWPPVMGFASFVRVRAARLAGADQLKQFWCHACQRRQAERSASSLRSAAIAAAVVAACALVLWYSGVIAHVEAALHHR